MSVLIALFILTSYTISVVCRWGVPKSLSRTYFSIKHKWIFSACVATSAGFLLPTLINILPEEWQWLGFLSVVGAVSVAFAPNLNDELQEQAHMGGAIILGLASQGVAAVICPLVLMIWLCWIPFAFSGSRIFWAEMIGGSILFLAIYL